MAGVSFQYQQPIEQGSANRMDIPCFIGLIDVRKDVDHRALDEWLYRQSWMNSASGEQATYHRASAINLLDVPLPIDSWESFDRLFAWDQRQYTKQIDGAGYLAAAVRSFFAQGGRLCYVVRVAGSQPYDSDTSTRRAVLPLLAPGYPNQISSQSSDRNSWHGLGHLFGLPDVSIVCLPDLPELCSAQARPVDPTATPVVPGIEGFVECTPADIAPLADHALQQIQAPVCDDEGYRQWAAAINRCARFLARYRRDVQLIVAFPLAEPTTLAARNPLAHLHQQGFFSATLTSSPHSVASAFVQLCYPWLSSSTAPLLAQGIEPGDGVMAGLLARNALQRGAFRSITALPLNNIHHVYPALSQQQQFAPYHRAASDQSPDAALIERLSLFGFGAQHIELLSDVTTSTSSLHRPASVNRIISLIIRILRQSGDEFVFENNGPALWAEISQRLNSVLQGLYEVGALRGKDARDAYFVRCDRSTMSQQDIDSGKVLVEVQIDPAASIESINVVLSLQQNGNVSLSATTTARAVA